MGSKGEILETQGEAPARHQKGEAVEVVDDAEFGAGQFGRKGWRPSQHVD